MQPDSQFDSPDQQTVRDSKKQTTGSKFFRILFYPFFAFEFGSKYNIVKFYIAYLLQSHDSKKYEKLNLSNKSNLLLSMSVSMFVLESFWIFWNLIDRFYILYQNTSSGNNYYFSIFIALFFIALFYFQMPIFLGINYFFYWLFVEILAKKTPLKQIFKSKL